MLFSHFLGQKLDIYKSYDVESNFKLLLQIRMRMEIEDFFNEEKDGNPNLMQKFDFLTPTSDVKNINKNEKIKIIKTKGFCLSSKGDSFLSTGETYVEEHAPFFARSSNYPIAKYNRTWTINQVH